MSKAHLKLQNKGNLFLRSTQVENLFINEFMPGAPGEYVKVYLFGLMYAQNDIEMDTSKLARIFQMDESDVVQAWEYWSRRGLINLHSGDSEQDFEIEYLSQIDQMYGKEQAAAQVQQQVETVYEESDDNPVARMVNLEIQAIFAKYEDITGKMLSREDALRIGRSIKTYGILPDVMSYAVEYCAAEDRASVSNILRTAENWVKEGCNNLLDVKEYIDKHSKRNAYYNIIFKEMGWKRLPSPADREMMDRWFDDMNYTLKDVLDACKLTAGLRDPSLRYVDKVLENKMMEAGGINTRKVSASRAPAQTATGRDEPPRIHVSKRVLKEYYDFIRSEAARKRDAHIDEVCADIVEMRGLFDFENNLNNEMLSLGFTREDKEKRQLIKQQRQHLEEDKRRLLSENGYGEDYLEINYKCNTCKDTGFTDDGRVCSCSSIRAEEAYIWNRKRS